MRRIIYYNLLQELENKLTDLNAEDTPVFSIIERQPKNFYSKIASLLRRFQYSEIEIDSRSIPHIYDFNVKNLTANISITNDIAAIVDAPFKLSALKLVTGTSAKIDLKHLIKLECLNELHLDQGEFINFPSIGHLKNLKTLTISRSNLRNIEFVGGLKRLKKLMLSHIPLLALNGIENSRLQELNLSYISPLFDLRQVSDTLFLQKLSLYTLPKVTSLPHLFKLKLLYYVLLGNMRRISDLNSLLTAPNLKELIVEGGKQFKPSDFEQIAKHPRLEKARIGLCSLRKNNAVRELLLEQGIPDHRLNDIR